MRCDINVIQASARKPRSSMRALRQIREVPSGVEGSPESLLAQFSASTLELNPSLGLRELCRRSDPSCHGTAGRSCLRSRLGRIHPMANCRSEWLRPTLGGFDSACALAWRCAEQASMPIGGLRYGSAVKILGIELAEALGWSDLLIAPLTGRGGKVLGVLCLVD